MNAVRRSTAILTLASFLLTWPASSGCNRLELTHTLKQFDLAIQEVHELRVALQKESGAWQQQLNKMQLKLTSDVRQVINHDVTRLVQEGIIRTGQELRCNVLFLETKVLAYLDGVESALRAKRDEIEAKGGLAGVNAESLIAEIIKRQGHIAPCVCHVLPDTNRIRYVYRDGVATLDEQNSDVTFVGFALQKSAGQYDLQLRGPGDTLRSVRDARDLLTVSNAAKIIVAVDKLASHLRPDDLELRLVWGDTTLGSIGLNITVVKPVPVQRQQVKAEFLQGHLGELIGIWPLQPNGKKMDVEMGSTKNDALVQCTSRFEIGRQGAREVVYLVVTFFCQEQGGDRTCFSGETRRVVFTAQPKQRIVRVVEAGQPFDTGVQRLKRTQFTVPGSPTNYGNLWGWRTLPQGLPLSYWRNLEVQVDNEWKTTSAGIVGLRGSIEFNVELQ